MSAMSPFSSTNGSPNQSPLSSPNNSHEFHGELHSGSEGSSCASMSTNSNSKVTPEILAEAYAWIEEIIDRLNDLSRSIRKSGRVQSDGKGENFVPRDESGRDLRPEFKSYALGVTQREIPGASDWLRERLIDSILARWSRLLYRRRHQAKLSGVAQHLGVFAQDRSQRKDTDTAVFATEPADNSVTQRASAPISTPKKQAMSSTYPSTMSGPEPLVKQMSSATDLSRKARSSIRGSRLDIPRPPRPTLKNNVFECPYCCILCPLEEATGSLWKLVFQPN